MTKEEKKKEIDFLYEWSKSIELSLAQLHDREVDETIFLSWDWVRERGLLSSFRELASDMVERCESMSPVKQEKMNAYLRDKWGLDIPMMKLRNKQKLDKALKRGYLKSDQEARMVEYWINEYCQAERPSEEIDPLNALLSDYEHRVEAKWAAQKAAKEAKQAAKRIN